MDLTLIETMPMGEIDGDRTDQYLPTVDRARQAHGPLDASGQSRIGRVGPARYVEVKETGGRLGLITPMTHNFCESCNRVRLTCTGTLYMCLGQDDAADLRTPLRMSSDDALLSEAKGSRLRHRPAHQEAGGGAAYERDRRLDPKSGVAAAVPREATSLRNASLSLVRCSFFSVERPCNGVCFRSSFVPRLGNGRAWPRWQSNAP
jgi:molybdenum cofactor biosynthesis enzyme MoaA